MDNSQELVAALNQHEITGDDTPLEDTAPQEPTKIENPTGAEKPAESEGEEPQTEPEEDETQPVEDEEGRKYVPEKRFKEIYAKHKDAERKLRLYEDQLRAISSQQPQQVPPTPARDKADFLENEILFNQYPQFDPTSDQYDEDLDNVAASIYTSGRATTKTEAARQALGLAKKLQSKTISIKEETKTFKKAVSEGNVVKPGQRIEAQFNPEAADVDDLEKHMRATGIWGAPTS